MAGHDPPATVSLAADFSFIRYAMCWEDAEILLAGLDVQPGDVCLSIASGGENSLSLLTQDPARVVAVDLSPAQIACLELKAAAYRHLKHGELLELVGARVSLRRFDLYRRLRDKLSRAGRQFWDSHPAGISAGIGTTGRFERYFGLFRRFVLPLIHSHGDLLTLFEPRAPEARRDFYDQVWNNRRWRWLFRLFFSRFAMGRLGRDPSFFNYVQGGIAERILLRVRHALRELDPAENPYLYWIAFGRFGALLPHALRPENFDPIRSRLDRLEWRACTVQQVLAKAGPASFDRFNLSDVFEYLSPGQSDALFEQIVEAGRRGGRVVYWNMLAPRRRPARLADRLQPLYGLSRRLHEQDKACFYSAFHVDKLK